MLAVDSFVQTVLASGLLDEQGLREALLQLPQDERADTRALAQYLVRSGQLSHFQAQKLLLGKSIGLVLGPYHLLAPIGKGGSSRVYLARDSRDRKLVALKVLPPKKARHERRHLARFMREMRLSRRVDHPHLARTYDVGVHDGAYYIAMEYAGGRSLYRAVSEDGPLSVGRAARLFAQAAAGLQHAHVRGLIHRDLKPSNILISASGEAKVLDLGLAIFDGEVADDPTVLGAPGYVVGTVDYLAPEQAEHPTRVDARADVYGLGCTLYFALTGRPPHPGGTARERIRRHRFEEPTPVGELNSRIPPEFDVVVRKMMAKNPQDRYGSAAEAREDLLKWCHLEQVSAVAPEEDTVYPESQTLVEPRPDLAPIDTGVPSQRHFAVRVAIWVGSVVALTLLGVGLGVVAFWLR
jgi:serine/threonine protein kinase